MFSTLLPNRILGDFRISFILFVCVIINLDFLVLFARRIGEYKGLREIAFFSMLDMQKG